MKYKSHEYNVFDFFGTYSWRCPECYARGEAYGTHTQAMQALVYHLDGHFFAAYGQLKS